MSEAFSISFYTLIKIYYTKSLSDLSQALSLAPDWIILLRRPRIPASLHDSTTTFQYFRQETVPQVFWAKIRKFHVTSGKLCPNFISWNIENSIFWAGKSAPHVFQWNEDFIFQTDNSVPQVSRLKCGKCQISGRKFYALSYWPKMRKIYFRQKTMHPNFLEWKVENFVFQAGNSAPWITCLKCRNCHI